MRLPRDVSGDELVRALGRVGYRLSRQSGSHVRLTTEEPREHHVTVPRHPALRVGTLAAILDSVAEQRGESRAELLQALFG